MENLKRICDEELTSGYELEVIDILRDPRSAEQDKIIATPTLVKRQPAPICKLVGDLSDRKRVMLELGIVSQESEVRL
jgi:circadian clock protein KaiB